MIVPVASSRVDLPRKRTFELPTGSTSSPFTRTRLLPLTSHVLSPTLRMQAPTALSLATAIFDTHSGGGCSIFTSALLLPTDVPPSPFTVVVTWCRPDFAKVWPPVIEPSDSTVPGLFFPSPQSMTTDRPGAGGTKPTTPLNGL